MIVDNITLDYANKKALEIQYYPGCCGNDWSEDDISMLQYYKYALQQHKIQERLGLEPCLSGRKLEKLNGKLNSLAGKTPCLVTNSFLEIQKNPEWVINNPQCVTYENWEKAVYASCDITFNINLLYDTCLTKNNVEYLIDVIPLIEQICTIDFNAKVDIDIDKCRLDYEVYSKNENCSISFESYQEIARCGITSMTMQSLAKCNVFLDYNKESQCPEFVFTTTRISACEVGDISIQI